MFASSNGSNGHRRLPRVCDKLRPLIERDESANGSSCAQRASTRGVCDSRPPGRCGEPDRQGPLAHGCGRQGGEPGTERARKGADCPTQVSETSTRRRMPTDEPPTAHAARGQRGRRHRLCPVPGPTCRRCVDRAQCASKNMRGPLLRMSAARCGAASVPADLPTRWGRPMLNSSVAPTNVAALVVGKARRAGMTAGEVRPRSADPGHRPATVTNIDRRGPTLHRTVPASGSPRPTRRHCASSRPLRR